MALEISDTQVKEIAEWLEMGEQCYIHKKSGELIHFPDPDLIDDMECWEEIIGKVEGQEDQYITFEKMDSTSAFEVMESFVKTLPVSHSTARLMTALSGSKPFRHFNHVIHESEFRDDWFDFRLEANMRWVREQL